VNDSLVMSEALAVLLVATALCIALGHHAAPTLRSGVLLGAVAGLAALTRSELAVAHPRLRVRLVAGVPPSPSGGVAGAGDRPRRSGHAAAMDRRQPRPLRRAGVAQHQRRQHPARRQLRSQLLRRRRWLGHPLLGRLDPSEDASVRAERRRDEALDYVAERLDRVPVVVAARIGRLVDVYGLRSMVANDAGEEKARSAVSAGIATWWLLLAAAVAGWVVLARARIRARWRLAVPCLAVLVTGDFRGWRRPGRLAA
jgi:hypothetical protein